MKKAILHYCLGGDLKTKTLEYTESCGVTVEDGIAHILIDGKAIMLINKERFIILEKVEEPQNKLHSTVTINLDEIVEQVGKSIRLSIERL